VIELGTLIINRTDSRCGGCGRSADPNEAGHYTELGWHGPKAGCGMLFVRARSDYTDITGSRRPDLPWVSW
jgi:hypothetical protein